MKSKISNNWHIGRQRAQQIPSLLPSSSPSSSANTLTYIYKLAASTHICEAVPPPPHGAIEHIIIKQTQAYASIPKNNRYYIIEFRQLLVESSSACGISCECYMLFTDIYIRCYNLIQHYIFRTAEILLHTYQYGYLSIYNSVLHTHARFSYHLVFVFCFSGAVVCVCLCVAPLRLAPWTKCEKCKWIGCKISTILVLWKIENSRKIMFSNGTIYGHHNSILYIYMLFGSSHLQRMNYNSIFIAAEEQKYKTIKI